MSGILDPKSRVLDTIVTLEGRRQLADGKLRVEYVSFTDAATFYEADVVSGSSDASKRLYLEQCHLPQDQISFEADDSGRLQPFNNKDNIQVKDGRLLAYSTTALTSSVLTGSNRSLRFLSGSEFASTAEDLIQSAIDNFTNIRVIGTKDAIFEDDGFGLGTNDIEFVINNNRPLADVDQHAAHIDFIDSLFSDIKLSKAINFHFLPPVNKIEDESVNKAYLKETLPYLLGRYKPWGRTHIGGLTPYQIEKELGYYEKMGYAKTISIDPTSRDNRLMAQFFEVNFNTLKKLDVIEFGKYSVAKGVTRTVFFVGKILLDGRGSHSFIHLFTLVFG